jgi:hypothetical protein
VPSTKRLAQAARDILDAAKIDINSQGNGLWLSPETHYTTFGDSYTIAVNQTLQEAYANGGTQSVLEALDQIAEGILAGTFP